MASRIKGITVEIGGSTTGLDKALSGVNKKINTTQAELRDVEKLLKLDPKNTILLQQKQQLLAKSVEDTKEKLDSLKTANEKAADSAKKYDAWKEAYDPIQQEIDVTQKKLFELKEAQKEISDAGDIETEEYKKLQGEISETARQLKELKQQAKDISEEFGNPISDSQYKALQREIIATENDLKQLENAAEKTENAIKGIDDDPLKDVARAADEAEEQLEQAGKEASNFGDYLEAGAIVEGAKGIASGLKDLSEESKEYMKIMGTLEESSKRAGYSAEQTEESYKKLYGVLGDEQTSATTLANLQALNVSQDELNTLMNMSIGAWGKYGDSIPIDGLAEAINETVKTGQVTGVLADVLNWGTGAEEMFGLKLKENVEFTELSSEELKKLTEEERANYEAKKAECEAIEEYNNSILEAATAEDKFNLALENAGTESERVNMILMALSGQGLEESGKAWEKNNETLVESNKANAELKEQLADLAETVMPLFTMLTEIVAGVLEKFNGLDENTQKFILSAVALVATLGPVISMVGGISNSITGMSGLMKMLTSKELPDLQGMFTKVFGFIAANPVVLLIAAIVGMVALVAAKGDEIQGILQNVDDFLQDVFATDWTDIFGPILGEPLNAFFANLKSIWDSAYQLFNGIIDFIRGVFTGDWERAWNGVKQIFSGIFEGLVTSAKMPLNGIIGLLNMVIGGVNSLVNGFNNIGFDMPEWLGGGSWHPNLPTISKIAYLANGGILASGTSVVGEAGPEILTVTGGKAVVQPLTGSAAAGNGLSELMGLLSMYLPYLAETKGVYLDTGVMVGEMAPAINDRLGALSERERNR